MKQEELLRSRTGKNMIVIYGETVKKFIGTFISGFSIKTIYQKAAKTELKDTELLHTNPYPVQAVQNGFGRSVLCKSVS